MPLCRAYGTDGGFPNGGSAGDGARGPPSNTDILNNIFKQNNYKVGSVWLPCQATTMARRCSTEDDGLTALALRR